jgi:hypothetical protein
MISMNRISIKKSMSTISKMEQYHTLDEYIDKYIGKRETPERESFEADVEAMIIGAAIKMSTNQNTKRLQKQSNV